MVNAARARFMATLAGAALVIAAACGGGKNDSPTPAPAPVLRVTNDTPCILHVRFDNGYPFGRVPPGTTAEFTDEKLPTYRYIKAESTQAIFRTYSMEQVRADGYTLTVKPAIDDHPCVEKP
jgi:hypothetical protein